MGVGHKMGHRFLDGNHRSAPRSITPYPALVGSMQEHSLSADLGFDFPWMFLSVVSSSTGSQVSSERQDISAGPH